MKRDILRENIDCYVGSGAVRDWSADAGLYTFERAIIERHFPQPPARVIDLGCGAGRTTIGLEAIGYDVDALDLADDLVGEARRRVKRGRVHAMDARALTFADGSFQAALFSFNGLDCVYPSNERDRVLTEVHRVLAPGGVFYYSGHNGLAAWLPRPGDSLAKVMRRNLRLLSAQTHPFSERTRYLAYPELHGTQVLYSASPRVHIRALTAAGFDSVAVYGVAGSSYRRGSEELMPITVADGIAGAIRGLAMTFPHVHYVARKPSPPRAA